jgi:hypothetical protein
MTSLYDENLLPPRASFTGPNLRSLRSVVHCDSSRTVLEYCSQSLTLTAFLTSPNRIQMFFPFDVIYPLVNFTAR